MRALTLSKFLMLLSLAVGCDGVLAQNAVTDWSAIAEKTVAANRPPASAEVLLGIVHVAMYDAVMAIEPGYEPFTSAGTASPNASPSAAAATAAYVVLKAKVPAQEPALSAAYQSFLATLRDDASTRGGIAVGERTAAAVLAWRKDDGFDATVAYVQRPSAPGMWEITGEPAVAVDVKLPHIKPLVLVSASQFRPAGPQVLTSDAYSQDLIETKRIGSKSSAVRTAAQTETALFWSEHTAIQWSRTLRNLAVERKLNVRESARLLAMAHVAAADALIACFDSKYHALGWRPAHAIQRSELTGAAAADKDWQPLLNVNHPEYPSAHACWTSATLAAIAAYFGTPNTAFTMESTVTKTARRYDNGADALAECTEARIMSGLHFRQAMTDGATLGTNVAQYVLAHKFRAVPPGVVIKAAIAGAPSVRP